MNTAVAQILTLRPDFIFNTLIGDSAYAFFGALRDAAATRSAASVSARRRCALGKVIYTHSRRVCSFARNSVFSNA